MLAQSGPICISVINMKGGVGKTTITALVGRYASRQLGLKVIAIDLDPQVITTAAIVVARRERARFERLRKRRRTTNGTSLSTKYLSPGDFRRSCVETSAIRETPCCTPTSPRNSSIT